MKPAAVLLGCALIFGAGAGAGPGSGVAGAAPIVDDPLVLPEGAALASLDLETNLTSPQAGAPTSVAPALWWGASPQLTLGVIHGHRSLDQIGAGAGICLHDPGGACDGRYQDVGLEARWGWRDGALAIAPRGRLLWRSFAPDKPAVTAGAELRWRRGRFAIIGEPYLQVGLANRARGNRDQLVLPARLLVAAGSRVALGLRLGLAGELATWRDGWHGAVGVEATVRVGAGFDLAVVVGAPTLFGPQNSSAVRALIVGVTWRGEALGAAAR